MILWSILRKLILVPFIILLTLIEWCGTFLTGIANKIINLLAFLLLIVASLSAVLGIADGAECRRMVAIALGCIISGNLLVLCAGVIIVVRNCLIELL